MIDPLEMFRPENVARRRREEIRIWIACAVAVLIGSPLLAAYFIIVARWLARLL